MSKQKVSITDNGIRSGVTSDVKRAICEYIWNGFDARANRVDILYEFNEVGYITSFAIKDDGEGIDRSQLHTTFGRYQDSNKVKSFQWSSQVKGHKGKGRYSFACFATQADWLSVYKQGERLLEHHISINKDDIVNFNDYSEEGDNVISHEEKTGTIVKFTNVTLSKEFLESSDFRDYLKKEYAVFLKLNESTGKCIVINGVELDYGSTIAESDYKIVNIDDEKIQGLSYQFKLTFIRWQEKMRENYSSYFLDSNQIERFEKTTTFNKKDTGFHHSLYVMSPYFDAFVPLNKEQEETEFGNISIPIPLDFEEFRGDKSEKDSIFKKLLKIITAWIGEKQKLFIQDIAGEELWNKYERDKIVDKPKNSYEYPLYTELKQTIKGIYSIQPKVFINLKLDQAKALVGCLKLLLQTDKREDLITIIDGIVKMTDEERHRLADILQKTEMSSITNTIAMLQDRLKTVSALKAMVFDETLNAYEVDDIQRIIGSAFWLFGEQYNIVTEAEPDFQQALEKYLTILHEKYKGKGKSAISVEKLTNPDKNKEMDVFATRQTSISNSVENIIVELKRPSVSLGELELSQIKTYMRVLLNEPQFNSTSAKWTFILVGNKIDNSGSIIAEYDTNKHWGKKDLVLKTSNANQDYEIYVKTWSTLLDDFELRHNFLLKRLQFKRELLSAQYGTKADLHAIIASAKEKN